MKFCANSIASGSDKRFLTLSLFCFLVFISACEQAPRTPTGPASVVDSPSKSEPDLVPHSETTTRQPDLARPSFQFRDATKEWNLDFMRFDDIRGQNLIQEVTGGGVAVFDYDLDGRLDLFFCQGSRLPRTKVTNEYSNELFRNIDHLQRTTEPAGLTSHGFHTGATVGDIDDDGFPDLYVTAYGKTSLWRNNGDGTFQKTDEAVVDSWSTSAILADFNDDGLLDLYVVTYVIADDDPPRICKDSRSPTGTVQCVPAFFSALDDFLFINNGRGGFTDVTRVAGITATDGKGLAAAACDINGDGNLDIVVANDGTPTFLYVGTGRNAPAEDSGPAIPTFEEKGAEFGVALTGEGRTISGMAVAHGDYDRDGWLDLFITNFYLEPNILFHNIGGSGFVDVSAQSRLGPSSRLRLSFGAEFLDVDNDGWLDLVVTAGHIEDRSWSGNEPYRMQPQLFRNDQNGKFTDVADNAGSYFRSLSLGRGLALGDLDRDGDLDVVISHREDPAVLLLNESAPGSHSVVIKPIGRIGSPRCGIGTRAIATGVTPVLLRDIAGGGSFQSASALELHFGFGDRPQLDELEFTWPDGHIDRWSSVTAGYYIAVQGRGLFPITSESVPR